MLPKKLPMSALATKGPGQDFSYLPRIRIPVAE